MLKKETTPANTAANKMCIKNVTGNNQLFKRLEIKTIHNFFFLRRSSTYRNSVTDFSNQQLILKFYLHYLANFNFLYETASHLVKWITYYESIKSLAYKVELFFNLCSVGNFHQIPKHFFTE